MERLMQLKGKWDVRDLFHNPQSVRLGGEEDVRAGKEGMVYIGREVGGGAFRGVLLCLWVM